MKWNVLVCPGSEISSNILCGHIGELWGCSHDSIARHLSEGWASESAGKLYAGRGDGGRRGLVVAVAVLGEGGGVGRDLEHDGVMEGLSASVRWELR